MKSNHRFCWRLPVAAVAALLAGGLLLAGCEATGDPMAEDGRQPSTNPAAENPLYHPQEPNIALEGAAAGMDPIQVQETWGSQEVLLNE